MRTLGLNRPHAGTLRLVASMPDCSQRSLADRLGILPSRIVVLIDELEAMELVRRERSPSDRAQLQTCADAQAPASLEAGFEACLST